MTWHVLKFKKTHEKGRWHVLEFKIFLANRWYFIESKKIHANSRCTFSNYKTRKANEPCALDSLLLSALLSTLRCAPDVQCRTMYTFLEFTKRRQIGQCHVLITHHYWKAPYAASNSS